MPTTSSTRVSIVIPVYNGANYLREAIDSALAQTHTNLEILVVDDGSDDDGSTAAIAARYRNRIRYIHQRNAGVSAALNRGIAEMSGDYFSWLSHDDLYYADKVSHQVAFLAAHPDVGIVASGLDIIDDSGAIVDTYRPDRATPIRSGREAMDYWIYGCSMLIHRGVLEATGGFNENNRTTQDLELWLEMIAAGQTVVLLPEILCAWRRHGASDSSRRRQLHHADVEQLFSTILSKYDLSFFALGPPPLTSTKRADTWEWLGEQARRRGASRAARTCYLRAALSDPSPYRRSFWRQLRKGSRRRPA